MNDKKSQESINCSLKNKSKSAFSLLYPSEPPLWEKDLCPLGVSRGHV